MEAWFVNDGRASTSCLPASGDKLETMAEVRDWRAGPGDVDLERGLHYSSLIGFEAHAPSVIRDAQGVVRWRCETQLKRSAYSPLNLVARPDWVVTDLEGREVLRVRRTGSFPLRFEMIENGASVGTIRRRGLLRNRYTLDFLSGPSWTFYLRLFTVHFGGVSTAGEMAWILVGPPKVQWNLLFQSGTADVRLLAALAFIHREWWCTA